MASERTWRSVDPAQAMLDQLALLIDEAEALGPLLGSLPTEIVVGRPFDGALSIVELLDDLVRRDRVERSERLRAFLEEGQGSSSGAEAATDSARDASDVQGVLTDLASARRQLIAIAGRVLEQGGPAAAVTHEGETTPIEYLRQIAQHDAEILSQVAERIYESRPTGSPGLTAH